MLIAQDNTYTHTLLWTGYKFYVLSCLLGNFSLTPANFQLTTPVPNLQPHPHIYHRVDLHCNVRSPAQNHQRKKLQLNSFHSFPQETTIGCLGLAM